MWLKICAAFGMKKQEKSKTWVSGHNEFFKWWICLNLISKFYFLCILWFSNVLSLYSKHVFSIYSLCVCILISLFMLHLLYRKCYAILCGALWGIESAEESQPDKWHGFSFVVSICWLTLKHPFSLPNTVPQMF